VQPHYIRVATHELRGTGVLVEASWDSHTAMKTPAMKEFQANAVLDLGARD
jgi:hypothetical protein